MPYGPAYAGSARPDGAELDRSPGVAVDGWQPRSPSGTPIRTVPVLYYTEDLHWTASGAMPAIRDLIRSLGPDLWRDEDVVVEGRRGSRRSWPGRSA